jgi:hypothetical protein
MTMVPAKISGATLRFRIERHRLSQRRDGGGECVALFYPDIDTNGPRFPDGFVSFVASRFFRFPVRCDRSTDESAKRCARSDWPTSIDLSFPA